MKTVFLRALEADDKAAVLQTAIREPAAARGKQRFEVDAASFAAVPRSPFAYWVSERLLTRFTALAPFEFASRTVKQGLATADDFRFLRCGWEVRLTDTPLSAWRPLSKGGTTHGYYTDYWLRINWRNGGRELASFTDRKTGKQRSAIRNAHYYGTPGFTYTLRAARFSPQILPTGVIISTRGSGIYLDGPGESQHVKNVGFAYLGLLNSLAFDSLIKLTLGRGGHPQFDMGDISTTPVPRFADHQLGLMALAHRAWSLRRSLDTRTETSYAFTLPALLQVEGNTCDARAAAWVERVHTMDAELVAVQVEIDERCFDLYGIDEADRRAITEGFATDAGEPNEADTGSDEEQESEKGTDAAALTAELVSWAVGVSFGRFDVRLATGAQPLREEPEPFDGLPVCSPAMLTGDDGLPLAGAPAGYPVHFPENGILVDDPGHPRDLTAAVQAVFEIVFGDRADAMLREAATLLNPKSHDLRAWLASDFFEHHIKRYSRSRRKAPILWQLGVPSGRFSVWLYAHRLAGDSFFQIRHDVIEPKLLYEERKLTSLVEDGGVSPSAKQRREIAAQEAFTEELRAMLDEVKRVAPGWSPTLDDGVVLTMAPLWRLVPQHKVWQRELKSRWEELEDGDYDWARIAMRYWPERVTAKCATDRSLAIAHELSE